MKVTFGKGTTNKHIFYPIIIICLPLPNSYGTNGAVREIVEESVVLFNDYLILFASVQA